MCNANKLRIASYYIYYFLLLLFIKRNGAADLMNAQLISNFTVNMIKTQQAVIFSCEQKDFHQLAVELMHWNQLVQPVHLKSNFSLRNILTRKNHARTAVIVNCGCSESSSLLAAASANQQFNKTYQWLLWDSLGINIDSLLPLTFDYVGPNAQITYVNRTNAGRVYSLWDVHSKGRHLGAKLELTLAAEWTLLPVGGRMTIRNDIHQLQSIRHRDQFNGLTLRGACVIDQDNITTNEQINSILSQPRKDPGVAAFIKYHYALMIILRDRFNFTVNFRNARGWAGRLGNSRYRLGFLGIVMRNEADIGVSGAYTRLNRFAEFDTLHQSWKFESAFLYRFTPDLNTQKKSGNFLAPFEQKVWLFSIITLLAVNLLWNLAQWIQQWLFKIQQQNLRHLHVQHYSRRQQQNDEQQENDGVISERKRINDEISFTGISLKTFAAVCQQGMEPIPSYVAARIIILTMFLFSFVMYNYYTSSVVGGLLSNTAEGPTTVAEIVESPLKISFEDIGYYKVHLRENKSPVVLQLIKRKLMPPRDSKDLPIYTHIEDAILHLRRGHVAFHCETVDAFPIIAKYFDVDEICDLREVPGLLESELINYVITKNSQYTEIFRILLFRMDEVGLIDRTLKEFRTKKPQCQSLYTIYPVSFFGVITAHGVLFGGAFLAFLVLAVEIINNRHRNRKQMSIKISN